VQLLPSSQLTGGWLHVPVAGSQRSCVHGRLSAQSFGVPRHVRAPPGDVMQVSLDVQLLRSSQVLPGAAGVPVQWLLASQVSAVVQELPSSHAVPGDSGCPVH